MQKGCSTSDVLPQQGQRLTGAGKAVTPSTVRDKQLIKASRVKESEKYTPTKDTSQEKAEQMTTGEDECDNLIIHGF